VAAEAATAKRFEAVFFDFDGVLIVSEPIWWAVIEAVLGRHGREIVARENGLRLGEAIRRQLPDDAELAAVVEEEVRREAVPRIQRHGLTDRRGIRRTVRRIHRNGIMLGVVSSSDSELLERVLSEHGIRDYFAVVIGGDHPNVRHGKPAPDCYEEAASQAKVDDRRRCCAVEDSANGIEAARAAEMYVV
jgi:pseudouridine-5'-monophosphatase